MSPGSLFPDRQDGNSHRDCEQFGTAALVGKSNRVFLPITIPTAGLAFTEKNTTLGEVLNSLVTADVNADGKPDLAVTEPCGTDLQSNTYHGVVTILLGKGDGTFHATPSPAVDQYPSAVAVGDFNGEGKPDIAVLTYVGATVVILLGKGDGTFTAAPLTPTVGGNPNSIAVGDLNGDGKLDLVVSSYNTLSVLLGKGDDSFSAIAPPTEGSQPGGVFLVDLKRDGKLDLVLRNGTSPYVSILLGHGNGTFGAATSPAAPTGPVSVMDVNRDGKPDLLFAEGNAPGFAQTTISVALGVGNGQFTAGPPSPVVDNRISGGFLADLNGDGKLDYAATGAIPTMFMSSSWDMDTGPSTLRPRSNPATTEAVQQSPRILTRMDGWTWQPATIRTTALSPYFCRCRLLNLNSCKHHRPQGRGFGCAPGLFAVPKMARVCTGFSPYIKPAKAFGL